MCISELLLPTAASQELTPEFSWPIWEKWRFDEYWFWLDELAFYVRITYHRGVPQGLG